MKRTYVFFRSDPEGLGSARISRVGDSVPAVANFSSSDRFSCGTRLGKRSFRRDAETGTRDACATQSIVLDAVH